jgi:hypothetical protein
MIKKQNKAFKQIQNEISKKSKIVGNLKSEDQGCFVDPSRNIAVTLDTKELSSALKHFERNKVTF